MSKDKLTIEVTDGVNTSKITTTEEGITLTANNIEIKTGTTDDTEKAVTIAPEGKEKRGEDKTDKKKVNVPDEKELDKIAEDVKNGKLKDAIGIKGEPGEPGNITVQSGTIEIKGDGNYSEEDKAFNKLVEDTMHGKYGTGRERMIELGTNYAKVQTEIVKRIRANK